MYRAYNLPKISFRSSSSEFKSGQEIASGFETKVDECISEFISPSTGHLQANLLTARWFPSVQADVFISHSHNDMNDVLCLSGWLYNNFSITAFIDSCVWGCAEKLLKLIDDEYCTTGHGVYSYDRRNYSTSHVHMMLSMALTKMIYQTECLFFYNTPNSITPDQVITSKTLSPWIFTEIGMTNLIQQRTPEEHRRLQKSLIESSSHYFSNEGFQMEYDVDISHLAKLDVDDLNCWEMNKGAFSSSEEALDFFYENWK